MNLKKKASNGLASRKECGNSSGSELKQRRYLIPKEQ